MQHAVRLFQKGGEIGKREREKKEEIFPFCEKRRIKQKYTFCKQ
jgi:hypothetical protein